MKNIIKIWLFVFILLSNLFAQQYKPEASLTSLSKKVNKTNTTNINILAVMVEFQEDTDGATFGDGKFGSIYKKDYGKSIIDPLPHDKQYFENHLLFAKNYYSKVSENKVTIDYTVLPNVIKVSKKMRDYSPLPKSSDFTPLGEFSKEVWQMVVAENPNLDFSQFNLFAVFHAGVGRDVNLPGSVGNERDLPSVYLSQGELKKIFGADFTGFPATNALITNSIILPETESREISGITGDVLLELSINGLIVSSIASHMGLPDLFDTNTGLSAIGRFGLMDGQAIFAYSGLFPPEPSAWEKIYLGWEIPHEISNSGQYQIVLTAKLVSQLLDSRIIKIPINNSEYFLIENRQRDAKKDGITLTIADNGSIITKTFPKDTTGFSIAGVDSLQGVILDVDEFDWAVPGNGIVIWHIDESVINSKIAENKINTDKFHRGVDVEEADGIQDIGEQFTTVFGDEIVGEGEDVDMWFLGNKSKLYKNRFAFDTKPNSLSYSGANSLVSVYDFSESENRMTFKVTIGTENISVNTDNIAAGNYSDNFKINDSYYFIKDGNLIKFLGNNQILLYSNFTNDNLKIAYKDSIIVGCFENKINIFNASRDTLITISLSENISTSPILKDNRISLGTANGKIYILIKSNNNWLVSSQNGSNIYDKPVIQLNSKIDAIMYEDRIVFSNNYFSLNNGEKFVKFMQFFNSNNTYTISLSNKNNFYIFNDGQLETSFAVQSENFVSNFIIAQLSHNGFYQILFTDKNKLWAYNLSGSVFDNFPIIYNDNVVLENYIYAANFDDDTISDLLLFSEDGEIMLFSSKAKSTLLGFPVSIGGKLSGMPYISITENNGIGNYNLNVISNDKIYYYNIIPNTTSLRLDYVSYFGSTNNDCQMYYTFLSTVEKGYFPEERAYNWPNPVYGSSTFIRYYVSENSNVNIKIFDYSGALVDEINTYGFGGNDNEVEWNVANIQSGVYLARIEAKGDLGNSGSKIIKIAVIK